jgi:ribosomal protein S18 acetylase RimI-like enzyme
LIFRPARPQDADRVVPLMRASSGTMLDTTFGADRVEAFLRSDFLRGNGIYGYAHQLVATSADGTVLATCTSYRGDRFRTLGMATLRTVFVHFGPIRVLGILRRMLAYRGQFAAPQPESLFLANLGVAPEHRGKGIGSQVLQHLLNTGSRSGATLVEFDVSFSNPDAQRLYERLGFTVTEDRPDRTGHEGFRRMRKPLIA